MNATRNLLSGALSFVSLCKIEIDYFIETKNMIAEPYEDPLVTSFPPLPRILRFQWLIKEGRNVYYPS